MSQAQFTPFVLLTSPRSGSNYLLNLLGQHPQARCFYELFHPRPEKRSPFIDFTYRDDQDGAAFAAAVFRWPYPPAVRAAGFKLFYANAQKPPASGVWRYLRDNPQVRIIELTRRNRFAAYVSLQIALKTDRWLHKRSVPAAKQRAAEPFAVDPGEFANYLEQQDELRAQALAAVEQNSRLELCYEDLCSDRRQVVGRLFEFLDLPRYPWIWMLRKKLLKQQRTPLSKQITNYHELHGQFQGTDHAGFFAGGR